MDKVTQSTASTAEETASASEELSGQASALRELVGGLEKLVGVAYQSSRPSSNGSRREILKTRLVPTPASAISPTQPALTSSKMNSDGEA